MLFFAYDDITYNADQTHVAVRPNCQIPPGPNPPEPPRWYSCGNLVPMCLLERGKLRCDRTALLLSAGQPFVYPLELRFPLKGRLTADAAMAPDLPVEVVAQVRIGRAIVLVWIGHEPLPLHLDDAGKTWAFDTIQKFIDDHELPPQQVWFVSGNVLAVHQFASWLRNRGRCEPETFRFRTLAISPATVRMQYHANERGEELNVSEHEDIWTFTLSSLGAAEFAERYIHPNEIAEEQRTGKVRPKRFLSMNRLPRHHRQVLVSYMHGKGLLDDSIVSFDAAPPELNDCCAFPVEQDFLRESWRALQPKLPLVIDRAAGVVSINFHRVAFGWPYRDAYINVVTETEIARDVSPINTEKLFKPMLNFQPFIAVSTAHTLRYLWATGFKGFSHLIDESYDQVLDPVERLVLILKQVERLGRMSLPEVRDLYFSCLPELEHNRAHLLEGHHELDDLFGDLEVQLG